MRREQTILVTLGINYKNMNYTCMYYIGKDEIFCDRSLTCIFFGKYPGKTEYEDAISRRNGISIHKPNKLNYLLLQDFKKIKPKKHKKIRKTMNLDA